MADQVSVCVGGGGGGGGLAPPPPLFIWSWGPGAHFTHGKNTA